MFDLHQKVAVVTGGGNGIGAAISETLAQKGSTVYILDINEKQGRIVEEKLHQNGFNGAFVYCDVSNLSMVKEVMGQIFSREKRIDILINNAGISNIGQADNTSATDFERVLEINVKGVFNFLHECIPYMKKSGGGVIINISSIAATLGLPDRFAYAMSKGAVNAMTYSVARDYIKDNIRCNAIAPARVHTPFVDGFLKKNYPGKEKEMYQKLEKTQPVGRMGKPEEIATLVLYLCSDEASFITGSIYPIDGGFTTLNT